MARFKCKDCHGGFSAVSIKEAEVALKELKASGETSLSGKSVGQFSYAKFCPYCGSLDILYTLGTKEKGHGHKG